MNDRSAAQPGPYSSSAKTASGGAPAPLVSVVRAMRASAKALLQNAAARRSRREQATRKDRKQPSYELRPVHLSVVKALCKRFHGYGSAGNAAVYSWAVYEDGHAVAAYTWQPPPTGAAKAVCPEAPQGVLALSRMVAVDADDRRLNHVSKPLRRQMRRLIDRTRWPVLVTYSDEGEGHTGHVYKCSGWEKTERVRRPFYVDEDGRRASSYSNGKHGGRELTRGGYTFLQRWEHWICEKGHALEWMESHGWRRVAVPGKVWRSGNPAFTYVRDDAWTEPADARDEERWISQQLAKGA